MRYALLPALLATGVASCDSTKPKSPLTETEAVALLHEIFSLPEEDGTVDCPLGGQATITSSLDEGEDGDSTWFSGRATILPTDCAVDVVSDTLTLNGKPDLKVTSDGWYVYDEDFEVVEGAAESTVTGAVTWRRRNDDSDVCSVDLTFESTEFDEFDGYKGNFTGRMCGHDIVIDISDLLE